jgi:hypothetical protein
VADSGNFSGGGLDIKIPISINLKNAAQQLKDWQSQLQAAAVAAPAVYKQLAAAGQPKADAVSGDWAEVSVEPYLDIWRINAVHKSQGHAMHEGAFEPWIDEVRNVPGGLRGGGQGGPGGRGGPPGRSGAPPAGGGGPPAGGGGGGAPPVGGGGFGAPRANASPGGGSFGNVFSRGIGALQSFVGSINNSIQTVTGGFVNLRAGGNLAPNIPGYRTLTQGNTANTSYFGAALGGAYNNINLAQRTLAAARTSAAAGDALGAITGKIGAALAIAGAVYKGAELAVKVGAMGTAALLGSGSKAATSIPGQVFNDLSATFDHINNIGASISNAAKLTAKFDDAVAAVTGKLPDTQFYVPQFYALESMQADYRSLLKRNLSTTKAGAYGRSDAADVMTDLFANALSGL